MTTSKTYLGNYRLWYKGYYAFVFKRPHGKWCIVIRFKGMYVASEGYHGTSIPSIDKAKKYFVSCVQLR